jgi:hypothetical protein
VGCLYSMELLQHGEQSGVGPPGRTFLRMHIMDDELPQSSPEIRSLWEAPENSVESRGEIFRLMRHDLLSRREAQFRRGGLDKAVHKAVDRANLPIVEMAQELIHLARGTFLKTVRLHTEERRHRLQYLGIPERQTLEQAQDAPSHLSGCLIGKGDGQEVLQTAAGDPVREDVLNEATGEQVCLAGTGRGLHSTDMRERECVVSRQDGAASGRCGDS